jgi:hypothetical protein
MPLNWLYLRKFTLIALGLVLIVFAGVSFYESRHLKEPVVLSQGVTQVKKLSDYFPGIKRTINDSNIYVLEGAKPGGTILILGGTHPEEPGSRLTTWILAENAVVDQGRLLVINSANRSATTVTRLGGGGQKFRMGDRWSNPLDQWPDPEAYIHYPSRQELAYVDIRNLNRAFPGRAKGTLTEKTCYALTQLIRKEKVDIVIDLHEAELQYPVISTISRERAEPGCSGFHDDIRHRRIQHRDGVFSPSLAWLISPRNRRPHPGHISSPGSS